MASFFAFLFFISLILLIVGLFKPNILKPVLKTEAVSRKKAGLILGSIMVVLFVIAGALAPSEPAKESVDSASKTQPTQTKASTASAKAKDTIKVTKVVDGDTIELEGGQKVRYIGIDTPETVDPNKKVQCYGKEASDKNKSLVEGKEVKLVKDVSETDKYGRLLRYVYVGDTFVNDYLVRQGYANASSYPPDVKYQDQFTKAEKEARDNNRGLWNSCKKEEAKTTTPAPTTTQPATPTTPSYTGGDKDCSDFKTHAEAQQFFISQGGPASDPHRLDNDKDGIACETLP